MQPALTCKLTAPALRQRRATVIHALNELLLKKEPTHGGYRYYFPEEDNVLDKLIDFIKSERLCCEFFTFCLIINKRQAMLEITGPDGTQEFLDHEVGFTTIT